VFPLEILPLTSLVAALIIGLVWFGILFSGIFLLLQKVCITAVCLPFVLLPLVLFSCGIAWFLASLATFLRDLPHIVALALQVLMFLSPIFYSLDMIPEPYKTFLKLNPLTYVIENTRKVLIYNQWPDWYVLTISTIIAGVVFQLGLMWFMKTKKGFADVL
jgi:lipopolysaccharide transport system permease protein